MGDIVVEVPAGFTGNIVIRLGSTGSDSAAQPAKTEHGWSPKVQEILERFAATDPSHDHVAMAENLRDLGFVGHAPQKKSGDGDSDRPYVRWRYAGAAKRLTVYQVIGGLVIDSKRHVEFAKTLEGHEPEGTVHPKVRFHYDFSSPEVVRAAAKALVAYADGAA